MFRTCEKEPIIGQAPIANTIDILSRFPRAFRIFLELCIAEYKPNFQKMKADLATSIFVDSPEEHAKLVKARRRACGLED